MPKIKTRKAAAKRFKVTKTGKFLRRRSRRRHLLEWKPAKRTRSWRKALTVKAPDIARVKSMLAGG